MVAKVSFNTIIEVCIGLRIDIGVDVSALLRISICLLVHSKVTDQTLLLLDHDDASIKVFS